jgi:hypothetical protein
MYYNLIEKEVEQITKTRIKSITDIDEHSLKKETKESRQAAHQTLN